MQIRTEGIVIKESNSGENDKYITILTAEHGTVEAYVKGARRKGSRLATSTALFCYSTFELFKSNTRYYVDQADINQLFYDIRLDLQRLTIASYFCQIIYEIKPDVDNCKELLRLMLNSMHLLANTKKDSRIIKAVFELRTMVISGLSPDLVACRECSQFDKKMRFYILEGNLLCTDCAGSLEASGEQTGYALITSSVLAAMRHIVFSSPEKVFSFTLDDENLKLLSEVCESYLLCQTERNYKSLDFLKTMDQ
ncbi:MAG: DNA repair protein RecO [Oscillospiraceae bacterium]|nr:DNA repair protein RecO [Oscillospiraceae bacterium]